MNAENIRQLIERRGYEVSCHQALNLCCWVAYGRSTSLLDPIRVEGADEIDALRELDRVVQRREAELTSPVCVRIPPQTSFHVDHDAAGDCIAVYTYDDGEDKPRVQIHLSRDEFLALTATLAVAAQRIQEADSND